MKCPNSEEEQEKGECPNCGKETCSKCSGFGHLNNLDFLSDGDQVCVIDEPKSNNKSVTLAIHH